MLAARAFGVAVIDGVALDLADDEGFRMACVQGRDMGFDGKTLIHPKTVAVANEVSAGVVLGVGCRFGFDLLRVAIGGLAAIIPKRLIARYTILCAREDPEERRMRQAVVGGERGGK